MSDLIKALNKLRHKEKCRIVWPSGLEMTAEMYTIGETDNGLEDDAPGYQEYYAAYVRVDSVDLARPEPDYIAPGVLIEVSDLAKPVSIYSLEGRLLWCDPGTVAPDQFDVVRLEDGREGTVLDVYVMRGLPVGFEIELGVAEESELRTVTKEQIAGIVWKAANGD